MFEKDVELMFKNCYLFNPSGNFVHECGQKLEAVYKDVLVSKAGDGDNAELDAQRH